MWTYLLVMVTPCLFITLIAKMLYKNKITTKEMFIALCANLLIASLSLLIFKGYAHVKMSDVEVLNGIVTGKEKTWVSCSHSYSCNCRQVCSGSGKSHSCSTHCNTCYDHSNDWDWDVYSTVGTFTIDRVDRRGEDEPPRWTQVKEGEHASSMSRYQNPLLADPSSLFVVDENIAGNYVVPDYPEAYDYYRYYRVLSSVKSVNQTEINDYLNHYLKMSGSIKQLNIIAVFTEYPPEYFNVLMAKWRGGKKNDVILVYGLDDNLNIKWFNSNSYAKGMNNREMHTKLRQEAVSNKFSMLVLTTQVKVIDNMFNRLSTEEFEYKKENIEIPTGLVFIVILLNLFVCFGVIYQIKENDL